MEIPNRNILEFRFSRELSRLTSQQRSRLSGYLGWPPDLNNVPDSFWQEVEEENSRVIGAWWGAVFLASAVLHGLDYDRAEYLSQLEAERRGLETARKVNATTQKRLDRLGDIWIEARQKDAIFKGEVNEALVKLLGPNRVANIAATETTVAQSAGGEVAMELTGKLSEYDTWYTAEDARVCVVCRLLHETKRSFWMSYFPEGPPAHGDCRCWIEYVNFDTPVQRFMQERRRRRR